MGSFLQRGRSVFDVATATNSLTLLYHGAIPLTTDDVKKMDQKINLDLIEQNRKILVADVKSGSIPVTSNDDLLQLAHRRLLELQQKKFKDDDGVLLTWTAEVVHHVSKNFVSIGQSRCVINRSEDQILLKYLQCVTERQQSGQDKLETVFVYVTDDGRIDLAGSIGTNVKRRPTMPILLNLQAFHLLFERKGPKRFVPIDGLSRTDAFANIASK